MADKKISQFDPTVLITGEEYVPIVQPVTGTKDNKRISIDQLIQRAKGQGTSLWIDCGDHDASTTVFPSSGSGDLNEVLRFNTFLITTAGIIVGVYVPAGSILVALQDSPTDDWDTTTGWRMI